MSAAWWFLLLPVVWVGRFLIDMALKDNVSVDTYVDATARARKTLFIVEPYSPRSETRGWRLPVQKCGTNVSIRYLSDKTSGALRSSVAEEMAARGKSFEARWISVPEFNDCLYFVDDTECWTVGLSTSSRLPTTSARGDILSVLAMFRQSFLQPHGIRLLQFFSSRSRHRIQTCDVNDWRGTTALI